MKKNKKNFYENFEPKFSKDLKIVHPEFVLRKDLLNQLPKNLSRLMISNRRRHDPNYVNQKQANQSAVISPDFLELLCNQCEKLRLIVIETGTDRFGSLRITKNMVQKKMSARGRICQIYLQNYSPFYGWGSGDRKTSELSDFDLDNFVEHYPEIRRSLYDIINIVTPFKI